MKIRILLLIVSLTIGAYMVNCQWDLQDYGVVIPSEQRIAYLWGTYKPNLYFAVKDRRNSTNVLGLMWYGAENEDFSNQGNITDRLRHECNMKDKLTYTWNYHNGKDLAVEEIRDEENGLKLETTFIKEIAERKEHVWDVLIKGNELDQYNSKALQNRNKQQREKRGESKAISLILYTSLENFLIQDKALINFENEEELFKQIKQIKEDTENKNINFDLIQKTNDTIKGYYQFSIPKEGLVDISFTKMRKKYEDTWRVKEFITSDLQNNELIELSQKSREYAKFGASRKLNSPNIIAIQIIVRAPFSIGIKYSTTKEKLNFDLNHIEHKISHHKEEFNRRFMKLYKPKFQSLSFAQDPKVKERVKLMMKQTLSNVFGGIGYYWGKIKIEFDEKAKKGPYIQGFRYALDDKGLVTASPSRSFFARGFLWDEGFHNIIISKYDMNMTMDIIDSWLSTMSATGYMAREQIRGAEQEAQVDSRFIVQDKLIANPPTFIFPVNSLINHYKYFFETKDLQQLHAFLKKVYDKFSNWFEWFEFFQKVNTSGKGNESKNSFYAWQGRNSEHNLASGLDDLPRGMTPNISERHIDLHIWVLELVKCLRQLAEIFDFELVKYFDDKIDSLKNSFSAFKDPSLKIFNDYLGPQFKLVSSKNYKRKVFPISWRGDNKCGDPKNAPNPIGADFTDCNPYSNNNCCSQFGWCGSGPDFCNCPECRKAVKLEDKGYPKEEIYNPHVGYVALFPLAFGILKEDTEEFSNIMNFLTSEDELFSPYGIRSLSKSDLLYHTGDDYWRGNIWINLNYLTLRGLHTYYRKNAQAMDAYKRIRENLVKTIYQQWEKTGLLYEQYADKTGEGLKAHPFNGWTSLVINIITEEYNVEIE